MNILEKIASFYLNREIVGYQCRITYFHQYYFWLHIKDIWIDVTKDYFSESHIDQNKLLLMWFEIELIVLVPEAVEQMYIATSPQVRAYVTEKYMPTDDKPIDELARFAISVLLRDPIALDMARDVLKL